MQTGLMTPKKIALVLPFPKCTEVSRSEEQLPSYGLFRIAAPLLSSGGLKWCPGHCKACMLSTKWGDLTVSRSPFLFAYSVNMRGGGGENTSVTWN